MEYSPEVFLTHLAQTTPFPFLVPIERAEGIYLYEPGGRRYIDLISGIGVTNIGHRHPKVVQAIKDQVDKHLHVMVYGEYIQSAPNLLAQKLGCVLDAGAPFPGDHDHPVEVWRHPAGGAA